MIINSICVLAHFSPWSTPHMLSNPLAPFIGLKQLLHLRLVSFFPSLKCPFNSFRRRGAHFNLKADICGSNASSKPVDLILCNIARAPEVFMREARREAAGKTRKMRRKKKKKDLVTSTHIFPSAMRELIAHSGVKRIEEVKDRREDLPDRNRHVYSCSETDEVLERASKPRMAPHPAWPSPLAGLSVFGL